MVAIWVRLGFSADLGLRSFFHHLVVKLLLAFGYYSFLLLLATGRS